MVGFGFVQNLMDFVRFFLIIQSSAEKTGFKISWGFVLLLSPYSLWQMILNRLSSYHICLVSTLQLCDRLVSSRASAFRGGSVCSNPTAASYQKCKNGTSSSLADAHILGVVLGRYSKPGCKYLLKILCCRISS